MQQERRVPVRLARPRRAQQGFDREVCDPTVIEALLDREHRPLLDQGHDPVGRAVEIGARPGIQVRHVRRTIAGEMANVIDRGRAWLGHLEPPLQFELITDDGTIWTGVLHPH